MPSNFQSWLMIIFGIALIVTYILFFTTGSNFENSNDVNKHIIIVSIPTAILTLLYGGITYLYFSANVNYVTPFLLISNTITLAISLIALSISSIRVTST